MSEPAPENDAIGALTISASARLRPGDLVRVTGPNSWELVEPASSDIDRLAELIWDTSRADEGTISAAGANRIARAIREAGWRPPLRGLHDCIGCGEQLDGDDSNEVCDECCPCGCPICVHETTGCRACWPECQISHADAVAASDARVNPPGSTGGA